MKIGDKIRMSFAKVKRDIDAVKVSFTDWVLFLRRKNEALEHRVRELENRLAEIEHRKQVIVY